MIQAPNPRAHVTPQVGGAARFLFDGVPGRITATVEYADRDHLTLRQELPFLRLDGSVQDEQGRRAKLTGVAVAVRDGTPALLLELSYGRAREATVPFQTEPPAPDGPPRQARRDLTEPCTHLARDPAETSDFNDEALRGDAPATPLTPLAIPTPKPAWHVTLWLRMRAAWRSLIS